MQITVYKNFYKKSNSTKQPSGGQTFDVKLKDNTSVESPVFIISSIDLDVNYVRWNNHYYSIVDIILLTNDIYELHCSQDLFATYKTDIQNYTGFVERSAVNYNEMITDPNVSPIGKVKRVQQASTVVTGLSRATGCYLLKIAGGDNRGITTYISEDLEAFGIIFNKEEYIDQVEFAEKIGLVIFNPFDYVISLTWSPIDINLYKTGHAGRAFWYFVKWFQITIPEQYEVYMMLDDTFVNSTSSINLPVPTYTDFRRFNNNFSNYQMYIPGVGGVPLSNDYTDTALSMQYTIDLLTGDIFYSLASASTDPLYNGLIGSYSGNIYKQLQISNSSINAASVVNSLSTAAVGLASLGAGNPVGAASLVTGTMQYFQSMLTPQPSTIGGDSSSVAVRQEPNIIVTLTEYESTEEPILEVVGKPCMKNFRLGDLSGYIKCGNASVSIDGLGADRAALNTLLNNGFFME